MVVTTAHVGQEERDVLVAMTGQDSDSLPPENPHLTVVTSQLHPDTWFTFTFKFKELGWKRARKRLKLVIKACTIFRHRLQQATAGILEKLLPAPRSPFIPRAHYRPSY